MPGINLSQPLLGAGAAARNDWASARARTALRPLKEDEWRELPSKDEALKDQSPVRP